MLLSSVEWQLNYSTVREVHQLRKNDAGSRAQQCAVHLHKPRAGLIEDHLGGARHRLRRQPKRSLPWQASRHAAICRVQAKGAGMHFGAAQLQQSARDMPHRAGMASPAVLQRQQPAHPRYCPPAIPALWPALNKPTCQCLDHEEHVGGAAAAEARHSIHHLAWPQGRALQLPGKAIALSGCRAGWKCTACRMLDTARSSFHGYASCMGARRGTARTAVPLTFSSTRMARPTELSSSCTKSESCCVAADPSAYAEAPHCVGEVRGAHRAWHLFLCCCFAEIVQ